MKGQQRHQQKRAVYDKKENGAYSALNLITVFTVGTVFPVQFSIAPFMRSRH